MVAGGTGLAPLSALVEQVALDWADRGDGPEVTLYHGARMPWDLYDRERLGELARHPWFTYHEVVSDLPSHDGLRGLVGTAAARAVAGRASGRDRSSALVCGSGDMVEHTVAELVSAGMDRDDIRHDEFTTSSRPPCTARRPTRPQE